MSDHTSTYGSGGHRHRHRHHHGDKKKKGLSKRQKRIILLVVLLIVVVLVALAAVAYAFISNTRTFDATSMFQQEELELPGLPEDFLSQDALSNESTIMYNGEEYIYNEDLINLLFIGVDVNEARRQNLSEFEGNQSDTLIVVSINTKTNETYMVSIPRDTVTRIATTTRDKEFAQYRDDVIALSHAYGDGGELSAVLTTEAVSHLLYDIPIYRYLTMDMDGIAAAVDAAGGITLELLDDFSTVDPRMQKGATLTLNGIQAEQYVRQRSLEGMTGLDTTARMPRQVQFMKAFFNVAKQKTKENITFPISLITSLGGHVNTNMSLSEVSYLAQAMFQTDIREGNTVTIPGEGEIVENKYYYYPNEEELQELVMETFYVKK